jgi:hypothetical protein
MKTHLLRLGRILLLPVVALLLSCNLWAAPKTLLVGIDGLQLERLSALNPPNFARLQICRSYTGGIVGEASQQSTYSGPGWATILTGTWAFKHQITSNSSGLASQNYPSIFKRLKQANSNLKVASLAHWGVINTQFFSTDVAEIDLVQSDLSDAEMVSKAINFMNSGGDFTFIHLDEPDHVGHSSGFGSSYDNSILVIDQQLGQLLNTVESLRAASGDDWLVLVTTDHGREASGYNHGEQTFSEKSTFIASNKPLNAEFTDVPGNIANTTLDGIYAYPAQTSITPTLLRHMGIEAQISWHLDGIPLLGPTGVRKLMTGNSNNLSWLSETTGSADLYRNGTLIQSLSLASGSWVDPLAPGLADYTLVFNNTPVSYRFGKLNMDITVGLNWDNNVAYFFRADNRYVRYNKVNDRADSGYPVNTDNSSWPGLGDYRDLLIAGFNAENGKSYFFLRDGRYIQYDNATDRADTGFPKPTNNTNWPGLGSYASSIKASLRWSGSKVMFFLANGTYLRYDLSRKNVDSGYPKPIDDSNWPGLGGYATQITSAIKWSDTQAYFFLTEQRYIRYNITADAVDVGYPMTVNGGTWPGLLTP